MTTRKMRPTVLVYQEYESLGFSPTDTNLPQVVVGPAYDIADYFSTTGKTDTSSGSSYDGTELAASMPASKNPGTVVEDELEVYLDGVEVDLEITDQGDTDEGEKTFTSSSASFISAGVVPSTCTAKIEGNYEVQATLKLDLNVSEDGILFTYLGSDNGQVVDIVQSSSQYISYGASTFEIGVDIAGGSVTASDIVAIVTAGSLNLSAVVNGTDQTLSTSHYGSLLGWVSSAIVVDNLTITEVTDTVLTFDRAINYSMTDADITIYREIADAKMDISELTYDSDADTVTIPAATEIPIREGHIYGNDLWGEDNVGSILFKKPIKSGTTAPVYIEYRSLRTDLQSIDTIGDTTEIATKVGIKDKRNPLGLGLHVAKANTTALIRFFGIPTNDAAGYQVAFDALSVSKNVYCINLLTDVASIISAGNAHCVGMSLPEKARFCVVTGGAELVTQDTIVSAQTDGYTTFNLSGQRRWLKDDNATFLTNGVTAGDKLVITSPTDIAKTYIVNKAVNETTIEIVSSVPFDSNETSVSYSVVRDLTKDTQAERIAALGSSIGSRRTIIVWPDEIVIEGETVEGFYLGCAIGGMTASLPPHQGFTTLGIAGVDEIVHSNDYFNDDQLEVIAGGGIWIFEQDEGALPVTRQQLTTDQSALEYGEYSIVKNLDHLSYFFAGLITDYLGDWNLTDENIGFIKGDLKGGISFKKAQKYPKIGAPILEANVATVEEFAGASDRVEAYVRVKVPKAINFIGLHVVSYN